MKKYTTTLVLWVCAIYLLQCKWDVEIHSQLPVVFRNYQVINNLKKMTGADSLYAYQATYQSGTEKVLVEAFFINPVSVQQETNNQDLDAVADELIKAIGYDLFPDSLIIHFIKRNDFLLFNTTSKITKSYSNDYYLDRFSKFFTSEILLFNSLDSLPVTSSWAEVKRICDSVLRDDPHNLTATLFMGRWILRDNIDNAAKAMTYFEKCLEIIPYDVDVNYNAGMSKYALNDYKEASKYFDRVIRQMPNFGMALYFRGEIYYAQKDYQNAIQYLKLAQENGVVIGDSLINNLNNKGY